MLTKTKIVLAASLIAGGASVALANDSGTNNGGGFVMPGSMDGVNPAYHPDLSPNNRASAGNSGQQAYGYVAPAKPSHKRIRPQDNR